MITFYNINGNGEPWLKLIFKGNVQPVQTQNLSMGFNGYGTGATQTTGRHQVGFFVKFYPSLFWVCKSTVMDRI